MRELLIATKNPGKYREIVEVFDGADLKTVFLGDLNLGDADFVEDGETFQENAFKKASYYARKTKMLTLAEDSGILVDALKGELGVKTRRWGAGECASDQEWIDFFLRKMEEVPDEKRGASFVCAACVVDGNNVQIFIGETSGKITKKLETPILKGLPLSSCFKPDGIDKVYAALSAEEKNKISHRGKAISKAKEFLVANNFAGGDNGEE